MNHQYYNDEQQYDRMTQSDKLSQSKKIRKYYDKHERNKQKDNTPKITNFFKKLSNAQKPISSNQKIQLNRKTAEQQLQIEALKQEQRELIYQEEQIKRQIQTLKSQQNMIKQQSRIFIKNIKNIKIADIKNRYEMIRQQKSFPEFSKANYFKGINIDQNKQNYNTNKVSLQIKQIDGKIFKIQTIIKQKGEEINKIQKRHLENQLLDLKNQREVISNLNEQYNQKRLLVQKQKNCKFSLMKWPLIGKKYQTLQLLGAGGYSQVYKALNVHKNHYVAIKLCSVAQMAQISQAVYLKHLIREFQTHKLLIHQNIVRLYEVIQLDRDTFCLVLQYCQGLQLSKYIKRKGKLSQFQTKSIMFQIFQAIYYLNSCSKKIIHYDLKPQNIMFHKGLIKILDFGLTKHIDDEQSRAALTSVGMGTYVYLPPECNNIINEGQNQYVLTSKIDVWSAGIIFYELLTGKRPNNLIDPQKYIKNQQICNISDQTIEIIKMCLKINPNQRISPQQIYFNPYFDQFERSYKRQK